ncbi:MULTISPECIES: hypothetical protein [unclassified Blautia]|uniref:hypothetical protein n=1 Tax=unclassified Blautia TaxID=2648079 RepID=UPI003F8ADF9F
MQVTVSNHKIASINILDAPNETASYCQNERKSNSDTSSNGNSERYSDTGSNTDARGNTNS